MNQSLIQPSGYKRTTDKQYSLLTHEMARVRVVDRSGKSPAAVSFWSALTEKLNSLGPPYRTVQQWKKVWTDFRRFHSKRDFKSTPKFTKRLKCESNLDSDKIRGEWKDEDEEDEEISNSNRKPATSIKVAQFLRSDWEDCEQSSQSMQSTNSNDFGDEYSYPDRQSSEQYHQHIPETLIPDENPYNSYSYATHDFEQPALRRSINTPPVLNHRSLPPLLPANNRLLDQTLYTLQNQMENQTKLLEHLSQISSTMAGLMERQVNAIEKQTETMRRQATATEHHTLVMNNFIDNLREKMPKGNSHTSTAAANLLNGST